LAKSLDDDHQFGYTTDLKKQKKEHTNTHTLEHTYGTIWGQITQKKLATREL